MPPRCRLLETQRRVNASPRTPDPGPTVDVSLPVSISKAKTYEAVMMVTADAPAAFTALTISTRQLRGEFDADGTFTAWLPRRLFPRAAFLS